MEVVRETFTKEHNVRLHDRELSRRRRVRCKVRVLVLVLLLQRLGTLPAHGDGLVEYLSSDALSVHLPSAHHAACCSL